MGWELQIASKRKFRNRVLLPGAFFLLLAAILCTGALVIAGRGADNLSRDAQELEVWRTLSGGLDDLSLGQEALGLCDDCIAAAPQADRHADWYLANVGQRLHDLYGADETYILDGADRPLLAFIDGQGAPASNYLRIAPSFEYMVALARGRQQRPNGASNLNERLPGVPSAPLVFPAQPGFINDPVLVQPSVRTSADTIHATDLVRLGEEVAFASVMRLARTSSLDAAASESAPLLVSLRYLNGPYLSHVDSLQFLVQPRLSDTLELQSDEASTHVVDSDGVVLTNLIWRPHLGGSLVVQNLLPPAIVMFTLVALIIGLAAIGMRRLMRKDDEQVGALHRAHCDLELAHRELEQTHAELTGKEAQAHHLAYHDVLTGLPNRAFFNDNADKALTRARHGEEAAIALLDLDNFKNINDRFGHLAGDALIADVARRITGVLARPDAVARLGGDEFAILLQGEDLDAGLQTILDKILEVLQRPFDLFGNQAHVGASIGVAIAPRNGSERGDLMRKADIALYRAKGEGRACYRLFTRSMDEAVQIRAALETELRMAIATGNGLCVHYQPLVDAGSGTATGFEALLRWNHPARGLIVPSRFVPVAEETGLICQLGDWVLTEACKVAREWPGRTIAINLSPVQFCDNGFVERLCTIVRAAGVSTSQVELEVTEGVVMDQNEKVRGALRRLRREGFRIALDDFGTGYSSLSYLRELEVDRIKIDRSFVNGLGQSMDAAAIVTAVVTLGRAIGLQVTAEGVETADQEIFLRSAGCHTLQGFLFSQAVPAENLHEALAAMPEWPATSAKSTTARAA